MPSGTDGGYSSPVVAGGRVYLYVNWRYRVPVATRTLSEGELRRLGWTDEALPPQLRQALERARTSAHRASLKGDDLQTWSESWVNSHLDEEQTKRLGSFVRGRLREGTDAIDLKTLDKLATIRGREFANEDDLNRWMDQQGISGDVRKRITARIPKEEQKAKDVIVCLNAANGQTLWKWELPGRAGGSHSTLCVAGGRCYGITSTREAICLDASTGKEIWKAACRGGHSSFLVEQGMAVVMADELTAFDAATGEICWTQPKVRTQNNSPVCWRAGETTYLICNTGRDVACVDLRKGEIQWTAEGGGPSTPAIDGNCMAILTSNKEIGLVAYRLSPQRAQRLWNLPDVTDRGASPIILDGHVYAVAGSKAVCADVRTGSIRWEGQPGRADVCSPVVADGKVLAVLNSGRTLAMIRATPDRYELLAKARLSMSICASPAFSGGRIYLRMKDGLGCFDLAGSATNASP